jgi:hypothetical protein
MSNPDEEFDLSHAEDKTAKNGASASKSLTKSKATPSRKRKREEENSSTHNNQNKGVKISNTTNFEDNEEAKVDQGKVNQNQQLLQEYNNLKMIYEERVNQQSHLYLRRLAHDKSIQLPHLAKYPLLQYI